MYSKLKSVKTNSVNFSNTLKTLIDNESTENIRNQITIPNRK